jgi:hypothetical protein
MTDPPLSGCSKKSICGTTEVFTDRHLQRETRGKPERNQRETRGKPERNQRETREKPERNQRESVKAGGFGFVVHFLRRLISPLQSDFLSKVSVAHFRLKKVMSCSKGLVCVSL